MDPFLTPQIKASFNEALYSLDNNSLAICLNKINTMKGSYDAEKFKDYALVVAMFCKIYSEVADVAAPQALKDLMDGLKNPEDNITVSDLEFVIDFLIDPLSAEHLSHLKKVVFYQKNHSLNKEKIKADNGLKILENVLDLLVDYKLTPNANKIERELEEATQQEKREKRAAQKQKAAETADKYTTAEWLSEIKILRDLGASEEKIALLDDILLNTPSTNRASLYKIMSEQKELKNLDIKLACIMTLKLLNDLKIEINSPQVQGQLKIFKSLDALDNTGPEFQTIIDRIKDFNETFLYDEDNNFGSTTFSIAHLKEFNTEFNLIMKPSKELQDLTFSLKQEAVTYGEATNDMLNNGIKALHQMDSEVLETLTPLLSSTSFDLKLAIIMAAKLHSDAYIPNPHNTLKQLIKNSARDLINAEKESPEIIENLNDFYLYNKSSHCSKRKALIPPATLQTRLVNFQKKLNQYKIQAQSKATKYTHTNYSKPEKKHLEIFEITEEQLKHGLTVNKKTHLTKTEALSLLNKKYRAIALKNHPDKSGKENEKAATEKFKEIGAAFERLKEYVEGNPEWPDQPSQPGTTTQQHSVRKAQRGYSKSA